MKKPICDQDPDSVSQKIYDSLLEDKPCMIARFGAFELNTLVNYLGVQRRETNIFKYIKGEGLDWWWDRQLIRSMHTNAGFFPPTKKKIEEFCELMLDDIPQYIGCLVPVTSKNAIQCITIIEPHYSIDHLGAFQIKISLGHPSERHFKGRDVRLGKGIFKRLQADKKLI